MKNRSSFQKAVFISFIFTGIGSVLNYLHQIILGNLLSVEEFGVFNAINSLAANVVIIFTPLSIMVCQVTALNRKNIRINAGIYKKILKISLGLSVLICIGGLFAFSFIEGKYGADCLFHWFVILLMIAVSGQFTIANSVVQGLERFVLYGSSGAILVLIKIIISVINIKAGDGVHGIVWAMLISYIIITIFISVLLKNIIFFNSTDEENQTPKNKKIIQLYGLTFIAQILVSFYMNGGEILLMGYLYDNRQVGLYSSAATLCKVSLYMISIISIVLFPKVANRSKEGVETQTVFYKTVTISAMLSILYAVFLMIGGKKLIPLMFGAEYLKAMEYIKYIIIFTIPLSTLSVIHHYFLGIGKIKVYIKVLAGVTAIALFLLILLRKNINYVPVFLGIALIVIIIWALWYVKHKI